MTICICAGGKPDGGLEPGDRVRSDPDVAAGPSHQHQHGAQHDAAEHDRGGPHHKPTEHSLNRC